MVLGMAVKDFGANEDFENLITSSGLTVVGKENLSIYIYCRLY